MAERPKRENAGRRATTTKAMEAAAKLRDVREGRARRTQQFEVGFEGQPSRSTSLYLSSSLASSFPFSVLILFFFLSFFFFFFFSFITFSFLVCFFCFSFANARHHLPQYNEEQSVYDVVGEDEYKRMVEEKRKDMDFIEGDDDLGYADNGEETWNDGKEEEDEEGDNAAKNFKLKRELPKAKQIPSVFLKGALKKKTEKKKDERIDELFAKELDNLSEPDRLSRFLHITFFVLFSY